MSDEVELWQIIRDWLPDAGWQILDVVPPWDYGPHAYAYATIRHGGNPVANVYDDHVIMLTGRSDESIKAVDPMFFCKLDLALTTIFSRHEWYHKKLSDPFGSRTRKKIWPKK